MLIAAQALINMSKGCIKLFPFFLQALSRYLLLNQVNYKIQVQSKHIFSVHGNLRR